MLKSKQAVIVSPNKLGSARKLPQSWKSAAGMMARHKRGMERYIAGVRKEWK